MPNDSIILSIRDVIDHTTISWFRVDDVDFEMWRAIFDLNKDKTTLSVWYQNDDDNWEFDVSTEVYGEIASGNAITLDSAKSKSVEAVVHEYPIES